MKTLTRRDAAFGSPVFFFCKRPLLFAGIVALAGAFTFLPERAFAADPRGSGIIPSTESERAPAPPSELERQTSTDLKEHKERIAAILETLIGKYEMLQKEVDALASDVKRLHERLDELESSEKPKAKRSPAQ